MGRYPPTIHSSNHAKHSLLVKGCLALIAPPPHTHTCDTMNNVRSSSTPLAAPFRARSPAASVGSLTHTTTRASSDAPNARATRACAVRESTRIVYN
jgi:hypothetical protein